MPVLADDSLEKYVRGRQGLTGAGEGEGAGEGAGAGIRSRRHGGVGPLWHEEEQQVNSVLLSTNLNQCKNLLKSVL